MTNILDQSTILKPKEEFLRLKEVNLLVPTEEQLAKARATARERGQDFTPQGTVRLQLVWEPLSYEIRGDFGNTTTDYLDVSYRLDDDMLPAVRDKGWLGIPDNKLIRFNDRTPAEDQQRPWPRFRVASREVLHLDVDTNNGLVFSNSIGKVFRCTEGYETFPRNVQKGGKWVQEGTNNRWMRIPREDVTETYVAPANPDVRVIESRGEASVITPQQSGALAAESLRSAVVDAGMIGMKAADLARAVSQITFITNHMETSPNTIVFGTAAVNAAASEGELLTYLENNGALRVNDEGIIE